jgi:hypothetical protein
MIVWIVAGVLSWGTVFALLWLMLGLHVMRADIGTIFFFAFSLFVALFSSAAENGARKDMLVSKRLLFRDNNGPPDS